MDIHGVAFEGDAFGWITYTHCSVAYPCYGNCFVSGRVFGCAPYGYITTCAAHCRAVAHLNTLRTIGKNRGWYAGGTFNNNIACTSATYIAPNTATMIEGGTAEVINVCS